MSISFPRYLTLDAATVYEKGALQCFLKIPNEEVKYLYQSIIKEWICGSTDISQLPIVLKSLVQGDMKTFAETLQDLVSNTMSFYDLSKEEPERVYHAFVLGLLVMLEDSYEVKSNRESGFGRYDVCLFPKKPSTLGIIFEFKKVRKEEDLEKSALEALEQIKEKRYAEEMQSRKVQDILQIGCAFQGKNVCVKHVK